jgi:hypothetical protein
MFEGLKICTLPVKTISENVRASSNRRAVPTLDFAAPGPQESLWAPTTMYRSKGEKKKTLHNQLLNVSLILKSRITTSVEGLKA